MMRTIVYGSRRARALAARAAALRGAAARGAAPAEAIVRAVERDGDAALVRLTAKLDGVRLTPARLRVKPQEIRRLARGADRELVAALERMARQIERLPPPAAGARLPQRAAGRLAARGDRAAAGLGRPLRARRLGRLSLVGADERDPGEGRRRRASGGRHAAAHARGEPRRRRGAAGRGRGGTRVPRRRRTGDRGARLRHEGDPARSTRSWARATPTSPRPSGWCAGASRSTARPGRARWRSWPTTPRTPASSRPTCWRRPSTAAATRRSCS